MNDMESQEKDQIKNVKEDIHNGANEMLLQCGNLKGELGVKCFSEVRDFKDDIREMFKGEVRY